jgi:photosystem II PsbZ protein
LIAIAKLLTARLIAELGEADIMTILFQLALGALVLLSFVMVVAVPVGLATPQNWDQSKRLILLGSGVWTVLVLVVGALSSFVV